MLRRECVLHIHNVSSSASYILVPFRVCVLDCRFFFVIAYPMCFPMVTKQRIRGINNDSGSIQHPTSERVRTHFPEAASHTIIPLVLASFDTRSLGHCAKRPAAIHRSVFDSHTFGANQQQYQNQTSSLYVCAKTREPRTLKKARKTDHHSCRRGVYRMCVAGNFVFCVLCRIVAIIVWKKVNQRTVLVWTILNTDRISFQPVAIIMQLMKN